MIRLILVAFLLFFAFGCNKKVFHYDPATKNIPIKEIREISTAPKTGEFLFIDSPEIKKAILDFKNSGRAPIIKKAGFLQYPFGETEPIIYCKPLRACDIELESGEEILGIALGDTTRWDVKPIYSGTPKNLTPHLIIKPKEFNISTNLIISTSRRTYHLGLLSKEDSYVRRVKFYYPHDLINFQANTEKLLHQKQSQEIASLPSLTASNLNFSYSITGSRRLPWRPTRTFDDGTHTYIQMPSTMNSHEAPALLIKQSNNTGQLVNYRVKNNFYVVDRLFDEAILITGVGRSQDVVTIKRE